MSLLSALMPGRKTAPQAATVLPGSPDAVEVDGRFVRVGDGYTTTLAVTGYPAEVGPAFKRAQQANADGHAMLLEFITSAERAFSHRRGL